MNWEGKERSRDEREGRKEGGERNRGTDEERVDRVGEIKINDSELVKLV